MIRMSRLFVLYFEMSSHKKPHYGGQLFVHKIVLATKKRILRDGICWTLFFGRATRW